MSERDAVHRTRGQPVTVQSLVSDLKEIGVEREMTLLVHSSLSALGWVAGGPVAVVLALEQVLGSEGTLVMPTHSGGLSDPEQWCNPPVPEAWWKTIRDATPAFDVNLTPTRKMGAIPECFRMQPGVLRSFHPQVSFAAWGAHADQVTGAHSLEFSLGNASPLARIYDLAGWVLLLGIGHANNTSLHLAEYRARFHSKREIKCGAPITVGGRREWVQFADLDLDDSDFQMIGQDFERDTGLACSRRIGYAEALLFPQRALVDYAVKWMENNRR
jgi:aminoglycoside 3-N-acetyltransferase